MWTSADNSKCSSCPIFPSTPFSCFQAFQHLSWPLLNHPPPPHTLVGDLALTLLLEEFRMGGVQFPSLHHHIPSFNHCSDEGKSKGKTNHVGNLIKKKKSVKQLKYHWEKQFKREQYKMKINNHKNQKKKQEEIYNIYHYCKSQANGFITIW